MRKSKKLSTSIFPILLFGSVVLIGATWLVARYWLYPPMVSNLQTSGISQISRSQSKPQNPPLPQGKTPFSVSSGKKDGPQFSQGFIDPYDPAVGQSQSITVEVSDSVGVSGVSVTIKTDTQTETHLMRRTSGTDTRGQWKGEWAVHDTHNQIYKAKLMATNANGEQNEIEMTLR
jgi:hypothetical protein